MPQLHAISIVEAWQDAVNHQDIERLLSLSDPDIKPVGSRGFGVGHQLLREWISRAGVRLDTLRTLARGHIVVLAQHGVWQSAEAGHGEQDVVSSFHVDGAG